MKTLGTVIALTWVLIGCTDNIKPMSPAVQKIGDGEYRVIGKLHKEEYDTIISIVDSNKDKRLSFFVTSLGGTSDDLILSMDTVYNHGNVHWYSVDNCDSACAVMALSTKHAHGRFRLHSFFSRHHHTLHEAPQYNKIILDKLESYGYHRDELSYMFNTVNDLWLITVNDDKIDVIGNR